MPSLVQLLKEFNKNVFDVAKTLGEELNSIDESYAAIKALVDQFALSFTAWTVEEVDKQICREKKKRKENNWNIVRRDNRHILFPTGEVIYTRTYMKNTKTNEYFYPADIIMKIPAYDHISQDLARKLTEKAVDTSYRKASNDVCEGRVSKQTVMNCVRKSLPKERPDLKDKTKLSVLHVDADEAHVRIVCEDEEKPTKPVYVPYISSYEGLDMHGKRHVCKNRVDYSRFGETPTDFSDLALSEIEKQYDLTDTKIYLHCDGGEWIKTLSDFLPNCTMVLDPYHATKYCKKMCSGLSKEEHDKYYEQIYSAVDNSDKELFENIYGELKSNYPQRNTTIDEAYQYLMAHWAAIEVRKTDEEARNGGASEPHVYHILASRLKHHGTWSAETLQRMAPLLSNRESPILLDAPIPELPKFAYEIQKKVGKKLRSSKNLGAVDPSKIGMPVLTNGTRTSLFKTLSAVVSC